MGAVQQSQKLALGMGPASLGVWSFPFLGPAPLTDGCWALLPTPTPPEPGKEVAVI